MDDGPGGDASSRYVTPSKYRGATPKARSTIDIMNAARYLLLSPPSSSLHLFNHNHQLMKSIPPFQYITENTLDDVESIKSQS